MKKIIFLVSVLMFSMQPLIGQLNVAKSTFKIEPVKFSPPTQDMINSFLGKPAPLFQANDLNQQSKTISNYYGKCLILFFWNTTDSLARDYIPYMNALNDELPSLRADLLTFGDESRSIVYDFVSKNNVQYNVIPNGLFLSEAIYGKELGTPRFFILDKKGVVKHIIPKEAAIDPTQTIANIKMVLEELRSNNE